ncbi:MAG: Cell division protein CpoB [Verrucomicrobiota bacterium]
MWLPWQKRFHGSTVRRWSGLGGMLLLGVLAGCEERSASLVPETEERAYRRGESFVREGSYSEALLQFQKVIDARGVAPESHLEAGLIFLNHLEDPVSAIYHFKRYLGFNPEGEHAERVQGLITTAKKEFMRSLPGDPFIDDVERLDLYTRLQELEQVNVELRRQLDEARSDLVAWQERGAELRRAISSLRERPDQPVPVAPIVVEQRILPGGNEAGQDGRTYTVQPGDTLSRISREMYGTSGRWSEIFQANRDQLPSQNALRPGQVLRIP